MAFDGLTVACLTHDLSQYLTDARVFKIAQTESDELVFTFKTREDLGRGRQVKLIMSAQAALPMIRFTTESKPSPMQAPSFCMLLRKYLENGKVMSVTQPGLERVIRIAVSHFDEMGDLKTSTLVIELMGKHSNIILINDEDIVLDSIRHVSSSVSSVREVLPGRTYFLPDTRHKRSPFEVSDVVTFTEVIKNAQTSEASSSIAASTSRVASSLNTALSSNAAPARDIHEALYTRLTGLSPVIAGEICYRAGVDAAAHPQSLTYEQLKALSDVLCELMDTVRKSEFTPCAYYENSKVAKAVEFAAVHLYSYEKATDDVAYKESARNETLAEKKESTIDRKNETDCFLLGQGNNDLFGDRNDANNVLITQKDSALNGDRNEAKERHRYTLREFSDMSALLESFYKQKSVQARIHGKSADLRQIVSTLVSRTATKYDKQLMQLKDTEKRDKFRVRGELLTAYAHEIPEGAKEAKLIDYNTGKEVVIPLDENLTPTENAQKFYERYQRMKRTYETLSVLTTEVKEELNYLESVRMALEMATTEEELSEIRQELVDEGFLKGRVSERASTRNGRNGTGKHQGQSGSIAGSPIGSAKKGESASMSGDRRAGDVPAGRISKNKALKNKYANGKSTGGKNGSGKNAGKGGIYTGGKGPSKTPESLPMHFVTTDGFDVYVGKNNFQNDQLTFHSQGKDDWWFHAKNIPGSHVVLKTGGREITDRAYEEAAALAAHFSAGRDAGKVEVDYMERKNVKKPAGAKPGFVVYYSNYSMVALTDISGLREAEED